MSALAPLRKRILPVGVLTIAICGYAAVLIISSRARLNLQYLHEIHADAARVYPPAQVVYDYWGSPWDSSGFNPFTHSVPVLHLIAGLAFYLGVISAGAWMIRRLPVARTWPFAIQVLSGFLPAYVISMLPVRMVLFALPSPYGAQVVLGVFITLAAVSTVSLLRGVRQSKGLHDIRTYLGRPLLQGLLALAVIVLCLVHRLQSGRNFLVPDSVIVFLSAAASIASRPAAGFIPTWDQQSDEWVFNSALWFGIEGSRVGLWGVLTGSLAMASTVGVIAGFSWVLIPRRFRVTGVVIAVLVPTLSSVSPIPWLYVSLVGGQNPLIYLGMPGRYAGVALPLLVAVVAPRFIKESITIPKAGLLILFSAGLGFMTLSTGISVLAAGVGAVVWTVFRESRQKTETDPSRHPRSHYYSLCALALAIAMLMIAFSTAQSDVAPGAYSAQSQDQTVAAGMLVLGALVCILAFIGNALGWKAAWPDVKTLKRSAVVLLGVIVTSVSVGTVISGNGVHRTLSELGFYESLSTALPGIAEPPLTRGVNFSAIAESLKFGEFSGVECWLTGHCTSPEGTLGSFGMFSLLVLTAAVAIAAGGPASRQSRFQMNVLLIAFAGFLVGVVIMDFLGATDLTTAWIKSRFIEPPLYAAIIAGLCALVGSRSSSVRAATIAASSAWVILGVLGSSIGEQWITNAVWLVSNL
jgi:hypothetical protein